MEYGTYTLPLWRVWHPKTKSYIHGLVGTKRDVESKFRDWLCNEFCDGWSPFWPIPEDCEVTQDEIKKRYQAARRTFRLAQVKVRVADDYDRKGGYLSIVEVR